MIKETKGDKRRQRRQREIEETVEERKGDSKRQAETVGDKYKE